MLSLRIPDERSGMIKTTPEKRLPEELRDSTILIVDDRIQNLKVLISYFKDSGVRILVARSGEEALEILQNTIPDLILLDVLMPGMDGFQVMESIKGTPELKEIPVIFLTALNDSRSEIKGFHMGAVDYIVKPVQLETVMSRVIAHLTLHYQKKKLAELSATKDRFFSIIAHDLRGPIGSIQTMTETIFSDFQDYSPEELQHLLGMLNESSQGVGKLLDNLLEWSRLESGNLYFFPECFNISTLTSDVMGLFQLQADQKGIMLETRFDPNLEVCGDRRMLQTILRNLINNALKFTERGGKVSLKIEPRDEEILQFSVTDNGVGMTREVLESLFQKNTVVKSRGTGGEKGSGLGLLICKAMLLQHGGEIFVESQPGDGSSFRFIIPRKHSHCMCNSEIISE